MDALKILGSLISSGALSKGSGGDVLGSILGAALGGSKNQQTQGGGSLGDILGSLVGGEKTSSGGGGLGDLLGSVLGGGKSSGSGGGSLGDLLGSVLGGGNSSSSAGGLGDLTGGGNSSQSTAKTAKELEDLLGIGKKSAPGLGGAGGLGGLLSGSLAKYAQVKNPNVENPKEDHCDHLSVDTDQKEAIDHATLIIRAMINAAKSDGNIDKAEQEKVLAKLGDITKEEIDFVRSEFAAPLDVTKFVNSVPRGMEEQIYAVSLMSIDLDKNSEARYLIELAKGLRIQPETANKLHEKLHVPKVFA